jgi:penicillin amidase
MKAIRPFVFSVIITFIITGLLNTSLGKVPPLGKIMDPFGGLWQNADYKKRIGQETITLDGLDSGVTISFDENLIPFIDAQNDRDLYFAQGYITASQRLWQMDFQVRVAAGRVAEVVGSAALNFDRLQRRQGFSYAASNALTSIARDKKFYPLIEAYVEGVNAYINSLEYKNFPLEYKLLNYSPENFTTLHLMYVMVLMVNDMCGTSYAIPNTVDYFALGKDLFELIFPDQLYESEPIAESGTVWRFNVEKIKAPDLVEVSPATNAAMHETNYSEKHVSGSNNWSINCIKSHNKRSTYLANDPHLTLSLPSVWHAIHLKSPTENVFGTTVPGIPGVLIGFNRDIAWGMTNTSMNVKGWYVIKFKDASRIEYLYDGIWLRSQFVTERIKIRGKQDYYDTVIYTHLGPVVYDYNFPNEQGYNNLAMKWAGHNPGKELLGLYKINKAKNYSEFEKALTNFRAPILSLNFASKDHDIALNIVGAIPHKWQGQARFVMPGHIVAYDWRNYIPQDHNPKVVNPKQGFVSSANQRATDDTYPYYYQHFSEERYRNKRINGLLKSNNKISIKDIMQLQNDTFNQMAYDTIDIIKKYVQVDKLNKDQASAYNDLIGWNFYNDIDKTAPSIFREWQKQLDKLLWQELYKCNHLPNFYRTLEILKNENLNSKLNLSQHGGLEYIIHTSFVRALDALLRWKVENNQLYNWGKYRVLKIDHLLGISSFGLNELKIGGGKHIVNANEGKGGASMRLIVEFANSPSAWFIYPGGQSGNPGSFYYDNLVGKWETGNYIEVSLDSNTNNPVSLFLKPKPKSKR